MHFIFALLSLVTSAHALHNLPCQGLLAANPNVVEFRGRLEAHYEQGFENSAMWSLIDDDIDQKLSRDPYDALIPLQKGDEIIITHPDGSEVARGFYDERVHSESQFTRVSYPGYVNRPFLTDANGLVLVRDNALIQYFVSEYNATVRRALADKELKVLNEKFAPMFEAYANHYPNSLLEIGLYDRVETRHFEQVLTGEIGFTVNGQIELRVDGQPTALQEFDRLFVEKEDGHVVRKTIRKTPYKGDSELNTLIKLPRKVTVIR